MLEIVRLLAVLSGFFRSFFPSFSLLDRATSVHSAKQLGSGDLLPGSVQGSSLCGPVLVVVVGGGRCAAGLLGGLARKMFGHRIVNPVHRTEIVNRSLTTTERRT